MFNYFIVFWKIKYLLSELLVEAVDHPLLGDKFVFGPFLIPPLYEGIAQHTAGR
jgi:hypothetical protein